MHVADSPIRLKQAKSLFVSILKGTQAMDQQVAHHRPAFFGIAAKEYRVHLSVENGGGSVVLRN